MTTCLIKYPALHGVRIWLSGSIPADIPKEQADSTAEFIRTFASAVFASGGHIIHGSHPTFAPILLDEAEKHQKNGGRQDCLTLAISRYWSNKSQTLPLAEWRKVCLVYETSEATEENGKEKSLEILRQWMAGNSDVFIAIGGKWWDQLGELAGVPIEIGLAIKHGVPGFLLGGFTGAASEFLKRHPDLLQNLKNGLDDETNRSIALEINPHTITNKIIDQLSRLPLVKGRVVDGVTFRILALDGGGIKGAFTASVLATLEDITKVSLVERFDLIAGTSTGGIIALGLGMGLSAKDILYFYRNKGKIIFPATRIYQRFYGKIKQLLCTKYSQKILHKELLTAFRKNNKNLTDSKCRLVIPAYDAISGACHIFRTPHNKNLTSDSRTKAVRVALATAAAPTYFNAAVIKQNIADHTYFDGGVWANCPTMAALIEAVCYLNIPVDRIDILSIGTTQEPFTVKTKISSGIFRWGKTLVELLMNTQIESSLKHAELLTGKPRFLRINATTRPGAYSLDGSSQINELISLGNRYGSELTTVSEVRSRFLNNISVIPWSC